MSLILLASLIFLCVAIWSGYNLYRVSRYTQEELEKILKDERDPGDGVE
jgi:hypothetical protein